MCIYCVAQLHDLCTDTAPIDGDDTNVQCCCWTSSVGTDVLGGTPQGAFGGDRGPNQTLGQLLAGAIAGGESPAKRGAPTKDGAELRDVLSTGRKRAALAKPITEGTVCEWAGLKFAGGGVKPIIGCAGNILVEERGKYARHHGPDKNVLNNSADNLHLVCPTCHNRWHTLNDPYYGDGTGSSRPPKGTVWLPNADMVKTHDGTTRATAVEILNNEIYWKTKPTERVESSDESNGDSE